MPLEADSKKKKFSDYEEEEGVVDLEGELIGALNELKKARKKNRKLKEQLFCVEDGMYNSDNEEFFIKEKKFERPLKVKQLISLIIRNTKNM